MNRCKYMLLALCVAAAVACAPAEAPDGTEVVGPPLRDDIGFDATTADPTLEQPATPDQQFVDEMMLDNQTQVELGQLAQERAQTRQVREFAALMVREHQQANVRLQKVATEARLDPAAPEGDPPDMLQTRERLEQLSGAEFDREYMRLMVERQADAVRKVEDRAERAEHEQVRQWAASTLPTLRTHLEQASEIQMGFETWPLT